MYNIFHMSMLEPNITKKRQVDEAMSQEEFEKNNNNEINEIEAKNDNRIYAKNH